MDPGPSPREGGRAGQKRVELGSVPAGYPDLRVWKTRGEVLEKETKLLESKGGPQTWAIRTERPRGRKGIKKKHDQEERGSLATRQPRSLILLTL